MHENSLRPIAYIAPEMLPAKANYGTNTIFLFWSVEVLFRRFSGGITY